MVLIAMMAASWPISLQVGASVVFRMLAPIRSPSASENECPSSMRLACTDAMPSARA